VYPKSNHGSGKEERSTGKIWTKILRLFVDTSNRKGKGCPEWVKNVAGHSKKEFTSFLSGRKKKEIPRVMGGEGQKTKSQERLSNKRWGGNLRALSRPPKKANRYRIGLKARNGMEKNRMVSD